MKGRGGTGWGGGSLKRKIKDWFGWVDKGRGGGGGGGGGRSRRRGYYSRDRTPTPGQRSVKSKCGTDDDNKQRSFLLRGVPLTRVSTPPFTRSS